MIEGTQDIVSKQTRIIQLINITNEVEYLNQLRQPGLSPLCGSYARGSQNQ